MNHIRHAFLGLIVLIIILFVSPKALALFGLPFADDLKPGIIFWKMTEISANFFGVKWGWSSGSDLQDINSTDTLPSDFSDL